MKRSGDSTLLLESNTNGEWSWFNSDTDTNFWAGILWLNGQYQAAVDTLLSQHSPKLFTRNPIPCFLEVDKTCVDVFGILPRFLKNLLESEIWFVVLRLGRKPHWVSFSFGSIISRHLFSRYLLGNVIFQISRKASRTTQNALAGHMRSAWLRPLVYGYQLHTWINRLKITWQRDPVLICANVL